MALTLTTPNTVLGVLSPKSQSARLVANLVTVVLGSFVLALAARTSVPLEPVAINLTTLAVAALAAGFGWRIGVATVALYIVQGLVGLPFFASPPYGGFEYVMRPSFGFIVGYLPMAYIIGRAADLGASGRPALLFLAMLVGDAVLFAFGFTWLLVVANIITQSGAALPSWLDAGNLIGTAWNGAVAPFLLWDVLKMAFAALSVVGVWKLLPKGDKAA
ncbi:biotin transporter BioY [Devosia sp. CN2-171]|jgi:biotin transport system substrate-specific component|uniref:biotin transporter BioY n=1 Tax=Devosia sp. CN2-171 TaxID=3400909 RepID=UPI003BF87303